MANGEYSAASAYSVQFLGAMNNSSMTKLWKAKTEPKCKFFAWLPVHGKVQTADNLAKKNYACNPICPLCYCIPETTEHLLLQCNFTEATWRELAAKLRLPAQTNLQFNGNISVAIDAITRTGSKTLKRKLLGILFSFWWQVWKERNRRIFDHNEQSFKQFAQLTKEAIQNLTLAEHLLRTRRSLTHPI